RLPEARDNQHRRHWRQMIGDLAQREDELGGKTLLVVGLGDIGGRLARLAKAFDMRVIGLRRDPARGGDADEVQPMSALNALLPDADFVALTCPLTPDTEKLIDAAALARMKPPAYLVNLARGRVVDEPALIETLAAHRIAGAAIGKGADLGGLEGADRYCQQLAQSAGAGSRTWHAYLSTQAADGKPAVNARDRIGKGPWQNAKGVVVAKDVDELHGQNNLTKQ